MFRGIPNPRNRPAARSDVFRARAGETCHLTLQRFAPEANVRTQLKNWAAIRMAALTEYC